MTAKKARVGRRRKSYSQAERLTRMMRILSSRSVMVSELAESLGITRRQVYRDLAQIEEQHHPLEQLIEGGEKVWRLPPQYQGLPPITVTRYELMALHLALSQLTYLSGTPFVDDLASLIKKVEDGLPAKTVNHLERLTHLFVPLQMPRRDYAAQRETLTQIQKGLLLQRRMVVQHTAAGHEHPVEFRLDPYALLIHRYGLYVAGHSHRANALRIFAVERIRSAHTLDEGFDAPDDLNLDEMYGNLFGLMNEPPQQIRVWFSADVAYLVKERRWHPSQSVAVQPDGSVIATLTAGGLEEVASWVLSWGGDAKVLAPPALITLVSSQLARAQRHYV